MATPTLVKGARATRSTVALKIIMAVSGLVFIGYVLAHMYGNLKAFAGHDAFNDYAEHLREFGEPMLPHEGFLWVMRVVLVVALVAHVAAAVALARRAANARTVKYQVKKNNHSSVSSRTMRWGGAALLLFLIWHLLNFTVPKVNPAGGPTDDAYNLMIDSFDIWWMTLIYLLAMLALGFHLHHGTFSAIQTLGFTNTASSRARAKQAGWVLAVVIAGGFSLVPLSVLAGIIEK
ncbi:succinate dehydrogenase cytochrome b subunit [Nocardioides marmotae]|uniref:Succinate dehydrogenase n=1 Tax=Nocardioides marmotae TaxID=2663857 RepID=A0A6I3J1L7_9ACTN|nr:succinate dehydrogenase cytochrome b subunit [Nocardioides marmotae]MCR6031312.1 succinate dehydrogenase [Gordonia jinghuaiqii]MBC9733669.1 succinate dehydrogenase cytochrome b subunit [Nocardioides marmotae]MTB84772.1 succinate dehydrogenase [Nocardioides marmotae]MTB94951.1 succinate dehydrogenase [Nocardioides marmotae]QKE02538.1 succinate dehydrogenase cytochrome b subunit [Nocardioides marmotae]